MVIVHLIDEEIILYEIHVKADVCTKFIRFYLNNAAFEERLI